MIQVENLTKNFDGFCALDGLNLHVERGSIYGLVGPNGAGKTTLIKHLSGVFRPNAGTVLINGAPVYENTTIKDRAIFLGDDLYFFPTYSIMDMANFYAKIYQSWDWKRFHQMKDVFKIDLTRRVTRLSKGMQKQVAFWLGLCARPDVMVLDEPVDGLDPVMRRGVWKLIMQDVAERQTTVLVSSHNLRELEDVCDHVGIMHQGKMMLEKSLDDVKGNIHKLQLAFPSEPAAEFFQAIDALHRADFGSVTTLICKGDLDEIQSIVSSYRPLFCDSLPLTLEEVFIYELGGMGYELKEIIL